MAINCETKLTKAEDLIYPNVLMPYRDGDYYDYENDCGRGHYMPYMSLEAIPIFCNINQFDM